MTERIAGAPLNGKPLDGTNTMVLGWAPVTMPIDEFEKTAAPITLGERTEYPTSNGCEQCEKFPTADVYARDIEKLVNDERGAIYGHPRDNMRRSAAILNAVLEKKLSEPITESDVCAVMIGMKLARLAHTPDHQDTWDDIEGYVKVRNQL